VSTTTVSNASPDSVYNFYMPDDANYKLENFYGNVLVTGHAKLYVTGSVQFTGNDTIDIAPGASLKLYVAASTAKIAGNGVLNEDGIATNFYYFGLPSNTTLTVSGNGTFIGAIYAPEAALTLDGGGHETTDFTGASVSQTARMNGHFKFHYDEALGKNGPPRGYVVKDWNEIGLQQN
jgi:hypothetical protein